MKLFLIILSFGLANAFSTPKPALELKTSLAMAPRFNGERWEVTDPSESPEAGYPAWKTLLMHGPKPWFERTFKTDEYEQAVLKFMAGDNCDRNAAQGNMDAYLRNPNDWAFNRFESEKRGTVIDYATLKPKNLILVVVWSSVVLSFGGRAVYCLSTGDGFYNF